MAPVHHRRDSAPRRVEEEPKFMRLVELLRRGQVEPERLDACIQRRQVPLFREGGEGGKNEA